MESPYDLSNPIALKSHEEILIGALSKLSPADVTKSKVIDYLSIVPIFSSADLQIGTEDVLQEVFQARHYGRLFTAFTALQGCSSQPTSPKCSLKLRNSPTKATVQSCGQYSFFE
jgi:hypothetical protein